MTTDIIESLTRERWTAADRAFETYDFGTAEVEDAGGWEYESPGTEMRRVIFLAADGRQPRHSVAQDSPTERAYFVVRFNDIRSPIVQESYAIASQGGIFGIPCTRA